MDDRIAELVRRAERDGLVDVAYATMDSPVGRLVLAQTSRGLVRVGFEREDADAVLVELSERISPRVLEAPGRLDDARRELDQYFEGRRQDFDLPLDWSLVTSSFRRKVLEATARIPFGVTRTYRDMAAEAGTPGAVRAAGSALGSNPIPLIVPCHRVLRTGGALGGYGGGLDIKRYLLDLESGRMALG